MGSVVLNIPEAFRTPCGSPRPGYQPIDDQSEETETRSCTKCEITTTLLCGSIVLSGFAFLYAGFIIPGLVLVLTIPVLCCIYSQLYDLDLCECCDCLRGICCCFKIFDLQATPGLPNPEPHVIHPQNIQIGFPDPPPGQVVFTAPSHVDKLAPASIISKKTNQRPQISERLVPGPSNLVPMTQEESIIDSFETAASFLESFETAASSLDSVETAMIPQNFGHPTTPRNEESIFKTINLKEAPVSPAMDELTLESSTEEKSVYGSSTAGKHETGAVPKKEPVPEPLNVQKPDPKPINAEDPKLKTGDTKDPVDTAESVPILVDRKESTLQSVNTEKTAHNEESVPLPDDAAQSVPLPDDAAQSVPLPDDAAQPAPGRLVFFQIEDQRFTRLFRRR